MPVLFAAAVFANNPRLQAQTEHPIKMEKIWSSGGAASMPPQGIQWVPDGGRVTYLSPESDLMQLLPTTGETSMLVSHSKLSALGSSPTNEKDKDHRSRYGMANYLWAPDSQHILFDSAGQLFVYTVKNGTAIDIASTGTGSGDDPKFSPNGQFVSYVRNHNLFVHRFKDQSTEEPLTATHEETLLNGEVDWVYLEELNVRSNYFWAPDSSRIAYLQMNEANVPEYPITDWIPVHATVDKQRYPQPGDPNPAGTGGRGKGAGRQDQLDQAAHRRRERLHTALRLGECGHALDRDADTRPEAPQHLLCRRAAAARPSWRYTETDEKFFDESIRRDQFSRPASFYLTSWRDGHTHIYRYGFDREQSDGGYSATAPLAHLMNQVTSGDYEVEAVSGILESQQTVYYVSNEGDPREKQVWSVKT